MQFRIVVADESEARFYDTERVGGELRPVGRIQDPQARLRDRDFKSDRPGRVFERAPAASGRRRGASARHGTGGEGDRRPRKYEAKLFAFRIAWQLEQEQRGKRFDRIVLMAPPSFLGLLRQALPRPLLMCVAAEVRKDLVHLPHEAVKAHLNDLWGFK